LTITGQNFGATQAEVAGQVFFSGASGSAAQNYLSWNSNQITVSVPTQLLQGESYTVLVTHSGGSSQNPNAAATFRANGPGCSAAPTATPVGAGTPSVTPTSTSTPLPAPRPTISGLAPTSGDCNIDVTITGTNFGATQATFDGSVVFNGPEGQHIAQIGTWSAGSITARVPTSLTNRQVYSVFVSTRGGPSNADRTFTPNPAPAPPGTCTGGSV
jgi:hypothetical protein